MLQGGPSRTTAVALGPLVCLRLPLRAVARRAARLQPLSAVSVQLSGLQDRAAQPEPHPDARRAGAAADGELSAGHRANGLFEENRLHLAEFLGCSHRQLLRALAGFCRAGDSAPGGAGLPDPRPPSGCGRPRAGCMPARPFAIPGCGRCGQRNSPSRAADRARVLHKKAKRQGGRNLGRPPDEGLPRRSGGPFLSSYHSR